MPNTNIRQGYIGFITILFIVAFAFFAFSTKADIITGLVAHWKFDETSGTTAADASGNGRNGTLVAGPMVGEDVR